jgi:uncharacterized protein (TIGR02246 family)
MKALRFWAVVVLAAISCRKESPVQEVDLAAVRKAVSEGDSKIIRAYEKGDAKILTDLFTDDATVMQPNVDPVKGHDQIYGQYARMFSLSEFSEWRITLQDLSASGSMAFEIGKYAFIIQPKGKERVAISGKYVTVWKQVDGSWRIALYATQPND